jgi:hypothetical protein
MQNNKDSTVNDWAMFTDEGDEQVQLIAERALDLAGSVTDQELWLWCWCRLELLSRNKEFAEAADTAVREQLWHWLHQEGLLSKDRPIDNWYPIDWYSADFGDQMERFVEQLESQ